MNLCFHRNVNINTEIWSDKSLMNLNIHFIHTYQILPCINRHLDTKDQVSKWRWGYLTGKPKIDKFSRRNTTTDRSSSCIPLRSIALRTNPMRHDGIREATIAISIKFSSTTIVLHVEITKSLNLTIYLHLFQVFHTNSSNPNTPVSNRKLNPKRRNEKSPHIHADMEKFEKIRS